jgi:hypothetical protein
MGISPGPVACRASDGPVYTLESVGQWACVLEHHLKVGLPRAGESPSSQNTMFASNTMCGFLKISNMLLLLMAATDGRTDGSTLLLTGR